LTASEINVAPVAAVQAPASVDEGATVQLGSLGSAGSGGSVAAYEWDFNYDGGTFDVYATGPSPEFDATNGDGPSSRTVGLRVRDDLGWYSPVVTSKIDIRNVPPRASVIGDTFGVPGLARTFRLGADDPSPADRAAGFTFEGRWSDGPSQTIA